MTPITPIYLAVVEDLMVNHTARLGVLVFENHTPRDDPNSVHIRVICPMSHHANGARELAYEVATSLLSEITNNDACDVVVRERSAHFSSHDDLQNYNDDLSTIIIDAMVMDYLS